MFPGFKQILIPVIIVFTGFFCFEFGFPVAIGEFLAGVLAGNLIDMNKIPWLSFFSYLGLLCLMFLAGFEVDIKILKKDLLRSILVGLGSFLVPYAVVYLVSISLGLTTKQALIMGTALSTTSLALVYTLLRESGQQGTRLSQILLGSAMVVDLASMVSLSFIFLDITIKNLIFLAVIIIFLVFVRYVVIFFFKRYKGNLFELELRFLLLTLLAVGLISDEAGIHAAVIAFLTGIIFSDIEKEHEAIIEKLNTVVYSLLAPMFFFYAGSLVSFREIDLNSILIILLFFLVAVAFKFFGTYLSLFFLYGRDSATARYGGIIFNYRLSFGIVTAIYAFGEKAIDNVLLNTILVVVVVSSIAAVFLEKKLTREIYLLKKR